CVRYGNIVVALQPDRGSRLDRKSGYHDAKMPPRHGYLAFYWWLRDVASVNALIHLGTHGNLEWLPGKSVALSSACWPEIALGPMPVIYPYIVSDPGEAAQAKRRIAAVTLSHLTPPLMPVALSPDLAALEMLVDEYSSADGLDARRMKLLRGEIIHRARRCGLPGDDDNALMNALESHLCDIKEQRVGDGLHIYGRDAPDAPPRFAGCGEHEMRNLLAALDGRFVMPGPGGSPVRGRLDILPTGRNMVTIDPRMVPTPTAAAIGRRAAEEFVRRYMQDHGDWPKSVVIDAWGSATLRNGGDEIAQALYLMGAQPSWDNASHRVTGFEILPENALAWPRIDVSLRISGLFRDMFANLITLFDDAARAVAKLEGRPPEWRIFGSAPGTYGAGVSGLIDNGCWSSRKELGQAYLSASQFAYGRDADGQAQPAALKQRIASAQAFLHVQDQRETDVLSGADFADAEGGFAAAAGLLGADPALYHLDTSRPQAIKARTLAEEISLTLQARALGQNWIAGQMRHGYAGAASFADVVDQLFAFAATTNAVAPAQFEAVFDAYVHDETVRHFIARANPEALLAIAGRFDEAIRRGLWNPLRNSTRTLLDSLHGTNSEVAA
ncbi:MAG: cobaltochelatase subunit CobN, partial [Pseudomonadota bacterium]|nr:cobaltochelatase subunit CobN [Pseudomonadota bacterium]